MKKILFIVLLASAICSCGTRKMNKTEISESYKSEQSNVTNQNIISETNIKQTTTVAESDNGLTVTEENTIEPVDPTKPATYTDENGNKHDLTNSKKTTRKTTVKSDYKKQQTSEVSLQESAKSETQSILTAKTEIKHEASAKNVDRENYWSWWWLLVPAGILVLVVWSYRKYRERIWFV